MANKINFPMTNRGEKELSDLSTAGARRLHLAGRALLLLGMSALGATAASAQGCIAATVANADQVLSACNQSIAQGKLSGRPLVNAYFYRAVAQIRKNRFDLAIADYDIVIRADPKYSEAIANRGYSYMGKGDNARAIQDFDTAIRLNPFIGTYRWRAKAFRALGNIDKAIQDYTTVLQLDRSDADAFYDRGYAYYAKGNLDATFKDVNEALRLRPGHVSAHGLLGLAYFYKSEFQKAIESFDHAVQLDPKYHFGLRYRGLAYFNSKQFDQAISDFTAAIATTTDAAEDYHDRGRAYYSKGDFGPALIDYNQAIRSGKPTAVYYLNRGLVRKRTSDISGAVEDYSEAIRLAPNDARGFTSRGLAYEATGDRDRARADYILASGLPVTEAGKPSSETAKARLAVLNPAPVVGKPAETAVRPAAPEGRRMALVIGNSAYKMKALANPANDARAISAALKQLGFVVVEGFDLDYTGMRRLISDFVVRSANAELSLVYYAGHGIQVQGHNYLVPVDARLESQKAASFELFDLDQVMATLDDESRTTIIILDACRNNPFATQTATRALDAQGGLAGYVSASSGMLIIYSTGPNQVAEDGDGEHSPFASALLQYMVVPDLEIHDVIRKVRVAVRNATNKKQQPWEVNSLVGEVYLAGRPRKSSAN